MPRPTSVHITEPESQDDLKAEVVGNLRSFVSSAFRNDESVCRTLGDAAFRSEVIDGLRTRAHGNIYCASVLLRQIKNQLHITGIRETPSQAGWDDIVEILMKAGVDPVSMDRNGKSPLYYAARNGYDRVISVVQGSKRVQSNSHELALAFLEAIEAGKADLVVRLLEYVNGSTRSERSTMHPRRAFRHPQANIASRNGYHPPTLAAERSNPASPGYQTGRADMAKVLLDHGADIYTRDDKKRNAIFETLKAPNTDGLSLLLNRGVRTDCCDSEGTTVLHQAAMDGAVEHARMLIDKGKVSKTTYNDEGLLPLHLAVRAQQSEMVDLLLNSGRVDVNVKGRGRAAGWTPLMYAVVAGSLKICDMLIQKGTHVNVNGSSDLRTLCRLALDADHYTIEGMIMAEKRRPEHN